MSAEWGGAALLLCAFGLVSRQWIGEQRRRIRLILAISQALERMVGAIRWQRLPFDRVLQEESRRMPGGEYFRKMQDYMKSDIPLQIAWEKAFDAFPSGKARELLCGMELSGDGQQIMGVLHLAAEELRRCGNDLALQQRQKERVFLAAGGCVTMMVIVILI